jgi:hypothetical protein
MRVCKQKITCKSHTRTNRKKELKQDKRKLCTVQHVNYTMIGGVGLTVIMLHASVADPDPVVSGPFWSDPDPDPGLNKGSYINFFGVCKSRK